MKSSLRFLMPLLVAATLWGQAPSGPDDLFVAPNGNAAWSGRLAAPNAQKSDGPLPSPQAALRQIQRLKALSVPMLALVIVEPGSHPEPPPDGMGENGSFHVLELGKMEESLARLGKV